MGVCCGRRSRWGLGIKLCNDCSVCERYFGVGGDCPRDWVVEGGFLQIELRWLANGCGMVRVIYPSFVATACFDDEQIRFPVHDLAVLLV